MHSSLTHRFPGVFCLLALTLALFCPTTHALTYEDCARDIIETITSVPGEIGGQVSSLREYVKEIKAKRDVIASEPDRDPDLLVRVNAWISGFEERLKGKRGDSSLPGYGLLDTGFVLDDPNVTLGDDGPPLFARLVKAIDQSPRYLALPLAQLEALYRQVTDDIAKLKTRNSPEDKLLIDRAEVWLKSLSAVIDLDRQLEAAYAEANGGNEVLEGIEALEGEAFSRFYAILSGNPGYKEALARTTLASLTEKQMVYYMSENPAAAAAFAETAAVYLPPRVRWDPFKVGATVKNLRTYTKVNQGLVAMLRRVNRPEDAALIYVGEEWVKACQSRLASAPADPTVNLDGMGVLGLSSYGGFRLAPENPKVNLFIPPALPITAFLNENSGNVRPPITAFEPEVRQLPTHLADLITLLKKDRVLQSAYRQFANGDSSPRDQIIALGKNDTLRHMAYVLSDQALHLEGLNPPPENVDVSFLGGGLVEQNIQNVFRQVAPELTTYTAERSNLLMSTFARGGYAVNLNSSSRLTDRTSLRQMVSGPGMPGGDLNFLPFGVLQLNQFEYRPNPVLLSMAEAGTINRSLAKKNYVDFNRTITPIPLFQSGGEATILSNLPTGKTVQSKAFIYTGSGDFIVPDVPNFKRLYESAKSTPRTLDEPPGIMSWEDLFDFILSARRPYSPFSRRRIGVIGAGDSGKAIQRWFNLLSDARSYGKDTREIELIASSPWLGQLCKTCDAFINQNRSFYADLGRAYRNGRIIAYDKLSGIKKTPDGYQLSAEGESVDVDYVVFAVGIRNDLRGYLSQFLQALSIDPSEYKSDLDLFEIVYGYEPSLGRVPLARQLVIRNQRFPFYLVGPAAGPGIVTPAELANNEENSVANTNHNWRAVQIAQALAAQIQLQNFGLNSVEKRATPPKPVLSNLSLSTQSFPKPTRDKDLQTGDELLFVTLLTQYIRSQYSVMDSAVYNLSFSALTGDTILAPAGLDRMFAQDQNMTNLIHTLIGPRSEEKSMEIRLTFGANGAIDANQTSWSLSP